MDYLLSSASCLASALVSTALQFISRFMRVSPLFHTVVKTLDRGKTKVGVLCTFFSPSVYVDPHIVCLWISTLVGEMVSGCVHTTPP